MFELKATVCWKRTGPEFLNGRYSRAHTWAFDGGITVPASPSPSVVPVPYSDLAHVDPEEAFVASISSCHLLTFLYLASRQGFQVDRYEDAPVGTMTQNQRGVPWMSWVTLNPSVIRSGDRIATPADKEHLHHLAHDQCSIANSIKTEVVVNGSKDA